MKNSATWAKAWVADFLYFCRQLKIFAAMNIEVFREYCLSLGDVEEKLPFAKMPGGDTVLAFYVNGHTFCYCDIDDFRTVIVKCQTERIPELMETTKGICPPDSHFNAKYWIGLEVQNIETETLKELVVNSYEIVRTKYKRKRN